MLFHLACDQGVWACQRDRGRKGKGLTIPSGSLPIIALLLVISISLQVSCSSLWIHFPTKLIAHGFFAVMST